MKVQTQLVDKGQTKKSITLALCQAGFSTHFFMKLISASFIERSILVFSCRNAVIYPTYDGGKSVIFNPK